MDTAGDMFEDPSPLGGPVLEPESEADPMRPETVRSRYPLPDPVTGVDRTWQRVSNLIKLAENTYHIELWKQRCTAKGLSLLPEAVAAAQHLDVKADKVRLNTIVAQAQQAAGAYRLRDEGTALHRSTELADRDTGSLTRVMERHQKRVRAYLDALAVNGLRVAAGMTERRIVSKRYDVAGTFDRIYRLGDGTYVIGDVKTGDSVELAMPSISGQLACYQDGVNAHGVWDGARYDKRIRVRRDFALVVHMPSTSDEAACEEVTVYRVDLLAGHEWNRVCAEVRDARKVKAKHISSVFQPDTYRAAGAAHESEWVERAYAVNTVGELLSLVDSIRSHGQYTETLATWFRFLAAELEK